MIAYLRAPAFFVKDDEYEKDLNKHRALTPGVPTNFTLFGFGPF